MSVRDSKPLTEPHADGSNNSETVATSRTLGEQPLEHVVSERDRMPFELGEPAQPRERHVTGHDRAAVSVVGKIDRLAPTHRDAVGVFVTRLRLQAHAR